LPPSTEHDVLAHGASLVHKGVVDSLAFIEHPTPASSALGSEHWKTLCAGYDLKDSQVVTVPYVYPQGHINTLHEAESFAAFVKDRSIRDVAVIAEPFHHVRATLTLLSALKRRGVKPSDVTIGTLPAPIDGEQGWHKYVSHSQGVVHGTKLQLLDGEMDRLQRYTDKGDLIPASEALAYFEPSSLES
ncbi:MAG: hypothetical protein VYC51_02435, partial [Pseudomonadota bacterium]|nr:hypothetical protein [Pseudomonadota bacterium]